MGRGDAPAKEISFVSLMAYGPKVSDTVLAMGGLQLLKPGRAVPNKGGKSDFPCSRRLRCTREAQDR